MTSNNHSCQKSILKWHRVDWSNLIENIVPYIIKFKCSPLKICYAVEGNNLHHEIVKHGMIISTMLNIEHFLVKFIHVDHIDFKNNMYIAYTYFYTRSDKTGSWLLQSPCRECFHTLPPQENMKYLFLEHTFQYNTPFIAGPPYL